jgi:hypothetical protein
MTGDDDDELEVSYAPDGIVVGAWNGATTKVRDSGGNLLSV